jgi:hypothetical protein
LYSKGLKTPWNTIIPVYFGPERNDQSFYAFTFKLTQVMKF